MTDWERRRKIDDLCEHIGTLCETVCKQVCKYPSEYKDPDDLDREQCSSCIIFELAEELKEETDGLL